MDIYELHITSMFSGQQRWWVVYHEGKSSLYASQHTSNGRGYVQLAPLTKIRDMSLYIPTDDSGGRDVSLRKLDEKDSNYVLQELGLAKLLEEA